EGLPEAVKVPCLPVRVWSARTHRGERWNYRNGSFALMTSVVLPVALAIIMFTLGLGLTVDDFKRVVLIPKGVGVGLFNLLLISPFLAFLLAELFNLNPEMAVGLVLLGATPGGTLANMFTHL